MRFFKKLFPLYLVVAAVTFGIFIIGSRSYQKSQGNNLTNILPIKLQDSALQSELSYETLESTPINRVESAVLDKTSGGDKLLPTEPRNLTAEIAKKIAAQMIEQNPLNADLLSGGKLNLTGPENLVDAELAEQLSNFDVDEFRPAVDTKAIKIDRSLNETARFGYLTAVNEALKNNFAVLRFNAGYEPQFSDFVAFEQSAHTALNQLQEISVPENLFSAHVKELEILAAFRKIFGVIKNAESDPVMALLAMQALGELTREFVELNENLTRAVVSNTPFNL